MSSTWMTTSVRVASGSLTAEKIEVAVGLAPARKVNRGDPVSPRSPSSGSHQQSFCIYQSPVNSACKPDEHIEWLTGFLTSTRHALVSLASQCEVDVRVGFSSSSGQGGLAFDAHELLLLGEVGARLNLDLYPSEEEE
jgi:hypothetical protein